MAPHPVRGGSALPLGELQQHLADFRRKTRSQQPPEIDPTWTNLRSVVEIEFASMDQAHHREKILRALGAIEGVSVQEIKDTSCFGIAVDEQNRSNLSMILERVAEVSPHGYEERPDGRHPYDLIRFTDLRWRDEKN